MVNSSNHIEGVFFDAHDTIIHLTSEAPDIYYIVGKEYGSKAEIDDYRKVYYALRDEWFSHPLRMEAIETKDSQKRKEWWRLFVQAVYKGIGMDVISEEHFERIYDSFTGTRYWRIFDDVIETLDILRNLGIKLGVISNWDTRLITILKDVGLYDKFDQVTISSHVGYEKPSPEIFKIAADRLGVQLRSSIYVGDSPEKDVIAANNAGMRGILIARNGLNFQNLETIVDLRELIDYIKHGT
jgi:putative hydrolase of the HAD superfamily